MSQVLGEMPVNIYFQIRVIFALHLWYTGVLMTARQPSTGA
jgi:hypothetical protein